MPSLGIHFEVLGVKGHCILHLEHVDGLKRTEDSLTPASVFEVEVYLQSSVTTIVFLGRQTFHSARAPRKQTKTTMQPHLYS